MKYNLEQLNRLHEIHEDKDIKGLSYAIFPGTHCPLFGTALTAAYIQNLALVVVGTSECTFYTKDFAHHRQGGTDMVYSLVMKDRDVVFGAAEQLSRFVKRIVERDNPDGVMIVTTCVVELIGEDYHGLVEELEKNTGKPIFVVNTEHYTCNNHIPGMEKSLTVLARIMEPQEEKQGVNILGHRQGGVQNTELSRVLEEYHIPIQMVIPSACSIEDIKKAPKAALNIVTDRIALGLAKEMKEKFEIPYLYFEKPMSQEYILQKYKELSQFFDLDLGEKLSAWNEEYLALYEKCRKLLKEKKFIYGNTPMMALETADFLCELGMVPTLIQLRELYEEDRPFQKRILERGYTPYVSRIANIAPLRSLYEELNSDLYIGHESPVLLKQKGMLQITFDEVAQNIGFELPIGMMKKIIRTLEGV